ncbi:MAG: acyl-CoA synthetase [Pseudomonadota bacterium]|nr:acyl-CoA synthetase [Pseudomonadota bacterium]
MKHPSFHARRTPEKIAYVMAGSGESLTYAQLDARSNRGAQALRALGVGPGDHIALLMENRLEFMEIVWAAHRAGVIYTAVSRYLGPEEAGYIIRDCGAKVFIASDAYRDRGPDYLAQAGDARCLMVGDCAPGYASWDELTAAQKEEPVADAFAGMDMLYSSGTTGRPKGIAKAFEPNPIEWIHPMLSLLIEHHSKVDDASVYLSPAPLYHAAPLRFCLTMANLGATCVIMEKFDPEAYLAAVQKWGVTHSQLVPTMFVRMLKLPEEVRAAYDVSSIRMAIHAAAPCPKEIKQRMIDWWGPVLLEYYAGTEANGGTVATAEQWLENPGTVGATIVGRIVIADPDGNELPAGEIGDVYFDSGIDFEYFGDPEKSKKSFLRPGCGTLGDVGYVNERGFLFLTDRAAYTIISGGVNIYPQEAEDLLVCHPEVADCAVFGVPDEEMGEAVKAVVQLQDPSGASDDKAAELIGWLRERLSHIKAPRSIDFREDLPRTATGKLMKRLLKDEYWAEARKNQGVSA